MIKKSQKEEKHWTHTYEKYAQVIYEVDADVYRNEELTQAEMEIVLDLVRSFGKELKSHILDLACGTGRHSFYLAKAGYEVIGLDYSRGFLEIAQKEAQENNLNNISFVQGDIRSLPFNSNSFKYVFLLGNSFGYFSDRENEKVLSEVYRVLEEEEGIFVFDITDKDSFLKSFKPYSKLDVDTPTFGKVIDERWRRWNEETKRIECRKKHTKINGEVLLDAPYDIRLYDEEEIGRILQKIGFKNITIKKFDGKDNLGLMQHRIFIACEK